MSEDERAGQEMVESRDWKDERGYEGSKDDEKEGEEG